MENIEIIDVNEYEVDAVETTPTVGSTTPNVSHTSLIGRNDGVQHSIAAIDGLREELNSIKAPRTVESDKVGVANYYMWKDKNPNKENRTGLFVTCCQDENKTEVIAAHSGGTEDVFGVTVDEAAFIGGQDSTIPRDHKYGLVVVNGFVKVRCDDTVCLGCNAIPSVGGIATKGAVNYGNKVVAIEEIDNIYYAKIFLGMSPKQASDMAGDVAVLEANMTKTEEDIKELSDVVGSLEAISSTNVDIVGGKIAGWDIENEDAGVMGLSHEFNQYKAVINANAKGDATPYVFGVVEKGETDKWKFGVKPNGETVMANATIDVMNVADADIESASIGDAAIDNITTNGGLIGGWTVTEGGLKVNYDECQYTVNGTWYWNFEDGASLPEIDESDYSSGEWSYTEDRNPEKTIFNNATVSKKFYDILWDYATPGEGGSASTTPTKSYVATLNSNTSEGGNTNIIEVTEDGETKFCLKLNGAATGYISNAGYADSAGTLTTNPRLINFDGSKIRVEVGGKASPAFTVPYAENANFANVAGRANSLADSVKATSAGYADSAGSIGTWRTQNNGHTLYAQGGGCTIAIAESKVNGRVFALGENLDPSTLTGARFYIKPDGTISICDTYYDATIYTIASSSEIKLMASITAWGKTEQVTLASLKSS